MNDKKELKILNRTIKIDVLNDDEMTLEADTKLVENALESMKLNGAKGVDSPRVRRNEEQTAQIENSEKLTSVESTLHCGGEEEVVKQVHTLFGRTAQVVCELQVQEVREVEGEHVDGMKDSLLEPRCACARCDVLTHRRNETVRAHAQTMWKSVKWSCRHWCTHRAVSPRNHGQFLICHFWSQFHLGPNFNL